MNSGDEKRLRRRIRHALVVALWLGCTIQCCAAPVGEALDRPALQTPRALHAVLQAAARAGERLVAVGERGIVLVSDDRGGQWRQVLVPTSVGLTGVCFVDARRGWAVGHGGVVLSTTDAGETWKRQLDWLQGARLLLAAARAAGDEKAVLEAQRLEADGADKPLLDVQFRDALHGWVIGAYNLAYSTGDGGATWQAMPGLLDNPKSLHLYALRVRGDRVLIAGEQGLVLLSQDAGRTFHRLVVPYRGSFFTAELLGEQEMLVAGLRGNVWHSRDSGLNWRQLLGGPPVNITASVVAADGQVVLASQAGLLLALRGETLVPVAEGLPMLNGLLEVSPQQWLTLSFSGPLSVKVQPAGATK